jgi:hypothetical protein
METKPFKEKTPKPTTVSLKNALATSFPFYQSLLGQVQGFGSEWIFSKMSGWMQKIADPKKSLCYIIPLNNSYKVNLTLRENERKLLIRDKTLKPLHAQISGARKYPEGFLMTFHVQDAAAAEECKLLIDKLIELR